MSNYRPASPQHAVRAQNHGPMKGASGPDHTDARPPPMESR
jgi:hypothetical protein